MYTFAGVTGDLNPAYIDESDAKDTMFYGRIAYGMLPAGLISAVIGMQLLGPGTIYLGQELSFRAPVHIGDTVTATVTVRSVDFECGRAELDTSCTNQGDVQVSTGTAKMMPSKA